MVGRRGGGGRYFKCRGGVGWRVQTETAVQCCMQLCAGLRLNKDELVMSNLTSTEQNCIIGILSKSLLCTFNILSSLRALSDQ